MARVVEFLDRAELGLPGHALVQLRFERSDSFAAGDGLTRQGVQRFRVSMSNGPSLWR